MDFRDLNYVIALARYGTIVTAAKSLYISQPSLTKFLQNLEHDVGVPLFNRVGKQYQLTYAGKRYVEKAERILDLKRQLDREMAEIAREDQGLLRVAFPLVRGSYILPNVLPAFHQLHPHVRVEVQEMDSSRLQSMLLQGDIDLAIFSQREVDSRLHYEPIAEEEYVLILPPGHPLIQMAHRGKQKYPWIDLASVANEDFIMLEGGQRSKAFMEKIFHDNKIEPRVVLTLRNNSTVIQMVNAGYGFSFVLESHILNLPKNKRPRCFSIGEEGVRMKCVAACRADSFHPRYEQDFIRMVRDFYENMLHA